MKDYEITYISDPQMNEEAREKLDATIDQKVAEFSGVTEHSSPSLRRRLAYEVNKKTTGFLRALQIKLDPKHISDVDEFLRKEASVMRYVILDSPRRADAEAEVIERHTQKHDKKKGGKPVSKTATTRPAKKVTMEDVEKGIEEALTEEVK